MPPINLHHYEAEAQRILSPAAWGYFHGGAGDEITVRENRAAFERIFLRPRALVDVSQRDLSTTVLGQHWDVPIAVAPMALQGLAHPEGDLASARAAAHVGAIMILSTAATRSIEEVATARQTAPQWFQLYVNRDRGLTQSLVQRAHAAGYSALVLTADTPIVGRRERDFAHKVDLPPGMVLANLTEAMRAYSGDAPDPSGFLQYFSNQVDPSISWKDVDWLATLSPLPIVVKGILRGDDAQRALDHGVRGIIVSNHGGRQLDGAVATVTALPEVVAAVDGRCDVLMDGGVRRGVDIVRAIALGAQAVLIGRPVLWGLALDGEAGARHVLNLLRAEFSLAMALCGCKTIAEIDRNLIG